MTTIPQRELRNDVSAILRRVERGERFTITVDGRPVAELGPPPRRPRFASPETFAAILSVPVDSEWAADHAKMRADDEGVAEDPWADGVDAP